MFPKEIKQMKLKDRLITRRFSNQHLYRSLFLLSPPTIFQIKNVHIQMVTYNYNFITIVKICHRSTKKNVYNTAAQMLYTLCIILCAWFHTENKNRKGDIDGDGDGDDDKQANEGDYKSIKPIFICSSKWERE